MNARSRLSDVFGNMVALPIAAAIVLAISPLLLMMWVWGRIDKRRLRRG